MIDVFRLTKRTRTSPVHSRTTCKLHTRTRCKSCLGARLPRAGLKRSWPIAIAMLRHRGGTNDALRLFSWQRCCIIWASPCAAPAVEASLFSCLSPPSCDIYLRPPTISSSSLLQTLVRKSLSASAVDLYTSRYASGTPRNDRSEGKVHTALPRRLTSP